MSHAFRTTLALGALVAGMFALSPDAPERQLPAVPQLDVPDASGVLVVDLVDGSTRADVEAIEQLVGAPLTWSAPTATRSAVVQGQVPDLDDAVAALQGHPLVEVAEPLVQLSAFGFPDDPLYERQWNLKAMGAPEAWSVGSLGAGVVVAVVDTGVSRVEDLEGTTLLAGRSFVPGASSADDDQGHGTHVAGTIAQTTNNGKGVAGVAPQATILPVKVLSKFGFGQSGWIASGIDYAVAEGAQVINLSLGGGYSAVIHNAIKKARAKGVIVVAAAGNSGRQGVGYPGALAETIGVSATGPDGTLAPYSSWGKGVDIAAPGGDKRQRHGGILQNTIDGKGGDHYVEFQGTSMATPHVAGAAAVLLSRGMPAEKVQQTLLTSARGDGSWSDRYGYGHLDLGAALGTTARATATLGILGGLFAFLLAQIGGTSAAFRARSTVAGALAAGGLFFLTWLPLPDLFILRLLSSGLLAWPEVLLGGGWMHFPLWASAALPLAAAFTLGAYHRTRPLALGLCAAFAASLFHGVATGSVAPWWLPAFVGQAWLLLNGAFAVLLGMGMAGTEVLEQMERRR